MIVAYAGQEQYKAETKEVWKDVYYCKVVWVLLTLGELGESTSILKIWKLPAFWSLSLLKLPWIWYSSSLLNQE